MNEQNEAGFINPLKSFWIAGYECADHLNKFGDRLDLLTSTEHLARLTSDYMSLLPFNIKTVREGISWSKVETSPYTYNWEHVEQMIQTARVCNIQQIWDLCHFGFPDDLTPLHPHFTRRFTSLCTAFVRFYRSVDHDGQLIITPINKVSFLSWLGGSAGETSPFCTNQGWHVKYALMRAYISGVAEIKALDPSALILSTEPLVNIVAPKIATSEELNAAWKANEHQFQVVEMLTGKLCPELGGHPNYLDITGYNYYYNNQWLSDQGSFLPWTNVPFDARWKSLRTLLEHAYSKFPLPFMLSETSHPGIDRPNWMNYVANECAALVGKLPFIGLCLYPILDTPDWNNSEIWHHAGLWDYEEANARKCYEPYLEAVKNAQNTIFAASELQSQHTY